jgi:pimeloyl-ACP methyl ester carboxylesterase
MNKKTGFERSLTLEEVDVNNSRQWISLSDTTVPARKPVLLFLHGGPGSANIVLLHSLAPRLEEHAIVVNWDQRGAGKSFHLLNANDELSVEKLIDDAHELTGYIKKKYGVKKIGIIGFSFGTVIGLHLMSRFPDNYFVYISVGQMVQGERGEMLALEYVRNKADELHDEDALKEIGKIHFDFSNPQNILGITQKARKFLVKYGGVYHTRNSYSHEITSIWKAREYSLIDFLFWPLGSLRSLKSMWHEVIETDFFNKVPKIEGPVVFMSGAHDMNTPVSLVREYYTSLVAPKGKSFILFENSAHAIFWDEPKRFEEEVMKVINKYADNYVACADPIDGR